jgi:AbrB family looped-hinge helix DNA binding protein
MSEEVTVGRRFTLVIPKAVRQLVGLKEGQRALVRAEAGRIIVEGLPANPYDVLAETIGDISYSEARHEERSEEWLRKVARVRHTSPVRS